MHSSRRGNGPPRSTRPEPVRTSSSPRTRQSTTPTAKHQMQAGCKDTPGPARKLGVRATVRSSHRGGIMTTAAERVDTHEMVIVHRVFRREFRLLPVMVRLVPAGDRDRATVVAGHAADKTSTLHHHHTGEDLLLWPKLLARARPRAELVQRMQAQHERVAVLLDRVDVL